MPGLLVFFPSKRPAIALRQPDDGALTGRVPSGSGDAATAAGALVLRNGRFVPNSWKTEGRRPMMVLRRAEPPEGADHETTARTQDYPLRAGPAGSRRPCLHNLTTPFRERPCARPILGASCGQSEAPDRRIGRRAKARRHHGRSRGPG